MRSKFGGSKFVRRLGGRVASSVSAYNPRLALGTDLLGWWDVQFISSPGAITYDGSNLVSSWKDNIAGYDATAVTTARPTYSAAGITFDGTANNLTLASQPFPSSDSPSEVWLLVTQDAAVADATIRLAFSYGASGSTVQRQVGRTVATSANRATIGVGNGSSGLSAPGTSQVLSSTHVIRAQFGATSSSLTTDGYADSSLSGVPATGTTRCVIGASSNNTRTSFWQGKVIAIFVTLPLSTVKASGLEANLLARANNPLFVEEDFES